MPNNSIEAPPASRGSVGAGSGRGSLLRPAPYALRAAKADRAKKRRHCVGNARRFDTASAAAPIFAAIKARLMEQHSPAQALGRLRRETEAFGPAPRMPSRATLYRLLEPLGWYNRERYPSMRLRRHYTQSELATRAERTPNSWVAQCPSVEQRPAYLTKRTLALCMEIDTIVGRKSDSARLVVAVCRHTRYTLIGWLKHATAASVEDWVRTRMREQPLPLVRLIPDQSLPRRRPGAASSLACQTSSR